MYFEIASDLYQAGITEDGERFTAETYYILATDESGNRWSHFTRFNGCMVEHHEDGTCFHDVRESAKAKAAKLLSRIEAAGLINSDYWSEARPMYGSDAYQAYGQADDLAWEKALG